MKDIVEDKGRIRPVVEGDFQCDADGNSTKYYEILSIVGVIQSECAKVAYISKKNVPIGTPITNEEYWYPLQVISVPKGDKGDKGDNGKSAYELYVEQGGTIATVDAWLESLHGKDGQSISARLSSNGQNIEISSDGGENWYILQKDFNKLRVVGYLDDIESLPISANIGDIYGVWESQATIEEPEAGVYNLYINTVTGWTVNYTITKVYDYDTELPASSLDGTIVLVPVSYLTVDKEKVDGYKVYRFDIIHNGWTLILDTAEIYTNKEDIVNHGDNVYALVQGDVEHTYKLYKRVVDWVEFGTNASITYHLIQDISEGTITNIISGKAIKDFAEETDTRCDNLEQNTLELTLVSSLNKVFYKDVAETITLSAALGNITPYTLDIKKDNVKINVENEPTVIYNQLLTDNVTTFVANATYKDATFTKYLELEARYPMYSIFADIDFAEDSVDLSTSVNSMTRLPAKLSAVGNYTITNDTNDIAYPYLFVPSDVVMPTYFSMNGAPMRHVATSVTINEISYTAFRLGSDSGYNDGVSLNVFAQNYL